MEEIRIITIDGPASSGKTTVARMLAQKLNIPLLESGTLYRLVTYFLVNSEKPFNNYLEDKQALLQFLRKIFKETKIEITPLGTFIYWNGKLIKEELRSKEVEDTVSQVSAIKEIREFLTEFMRGLAEKSKLIAEGRDMGSAVFPYSDVKIFLTADEKIRAERRFKEKAEKEEIDKEFLYKEVWDNIKFRDRLDSQRKIAPLTIPEGAYIIDTSYLTPEEVMNEILKIIKNRER
ncbi:MAG: Cytidylate kinase [Thermodesulfobacterium sp.]|uniref:Cytidylate kinase n=1 Tax=Candidatus Thermodesulfobacterium syntrophicum TaxID=3060442 RepID=A0AAE3P5I0_9BACT|nr:Cytidylate kinase [Candidatus Thermodesulfobacterium syntrophicum]